MALFDYIFNFTAIGIVFLVFYKYGFQIIWSLLYIIFLIILLFIVLAIEFICILLVAWILTFIQNTIGFQIIFKFTIIGIFILLVAHYGTLYLKALVKAEVERHLSYPTKPIVLK